MEGDTKERGGESRVGEGRRMRGGSDKKEVVSRVTDAYIVHGYVQLTVDLSLC